jgi:hypothetical protein
MNYVLFGGAALIGVLVLFQLVRKTDVRKLVRWLRWGVGGAIALLTGFLLLRGQVGIASVTGYVAYSILRFGRIGPLVFDAGISEANESKVTSKYFAMTLDHDSGAVAGRVTSGAFAGTDLIELGEAETRQLLAEVATDPDSLALLETWLDRNRAGWREYFAEQAGPEQPASPGDEDEQAYEILGLQPGATAGEIHAAHRRLMKGVHPDQGGSTYLAAKINEAKDRLLKKVGGR